MYGVLRHYDLPDLLAVIKAAVLLLEPFGARNLLRGASDCETGQVSRIFLWLGGSTSSFQSEISSFH